MEYFAGIDVSLEQSSVCVVDAAGKIVREAKVASEPDALVRFFRELGFPMVRIGLEAGPLSQWLYAGLTEAGLAMVLLETRHVKAALSAMARTQHFCHEPPFDRPAHLAARGGHPRGRRQGLEPAISA